MEPAKAERDLPGGCAGCQEEMPWFPQFGFIFTSLFICTWEDVLASSGAEVESEHKVPRSFLSSHPVDLGGSVCPISKFLLITLKANCFFLHGYSSESHAFSLLMIELSLSKPNPSNHGVLSVGGG